MSDYCVCAYNGAVTNLHRSYDNRTGKDRYTVTNAGESRVIYASDAQCHVLVNGYGAANLYACPNHNSGGVRKI